MASRANRHSIPSASNLSRHNCKQTSSSSSSTASTARHPIRPASNPSYQHHKGERTSSSSTAKQPIPPASNISHGKGKQISSSSSTAACTPLSPSFSSTAKHIIRPASNISHGKGKQTSSASSSAATCLPPPPSSSTASPPIPPVSNLSHRKSKQTFSSSTATCPPVALPSSSSVDHPEIKYDVFVSFRGPDVRSSFLSHFLEALSREKIDCFVDDKNLKPGDEISSTLLDAIRKSEISLVLLSKDYASSTWCLEELEQIIQCMEDENQNQIILPIFYKVDPSTVRHQKGEYHKAFDKHGKRIDNDKLQKWKAALKRASDLSGFDSSKYKTEANFITAIVRCVLKRLNMRSHQSDLKGLVGIQKHIAHLEAWLCKRTQGVLVIGIWGMGGIGKTTIAEVLFNRLYHEYEGRYFLNVREGLEKHGRTQLKEQLLSKLLGEDPDIVLHNGILLNCLRRLRRKKVLVVLDDIHKLMQLEILIGGCEWFGSDSKIIITSRDKNVLIKECDYIYEVKQLNYEEALQLFNLNALPHICIDREEEWYKFSKMVVGYCNGNPLAIKVLGRSLCDNDKNEWKSKLKELDKILDSDIQDVLELSYKELDDKQKDIFLYLACFFQSGPKKYIISLLDDDEFHTIYGLRVLQNKALINIDNHGQVTIHDLIEKMGHEIVRKKSPKNPGLRKHLWDANDIYKVLKNNMGTEEIESISLTMERLKNDLHLTSQAFARMDNLKLLRFTSIKSEAKFKVYAPEEDFILPTGLRLIHWDFCPSKSIPIRSSLENLVELRMEFSCMQKLWDGIQELPSLEVIDFHCSSNLIGLPDLSRAPKLREVRLYYCHRLRHVPLWPDHTTDELDSTECEEYLNQNNLPASLDTINDYLHWNSPPASTLPYYVLLSLQSLDLGACGSIFELPDNIGLYLPLLNWLNIARTNLETLPTSIKHLTKLRSLFVYSCWSLRYIPELPPSLDFLSAAGCTSLETLQFSLNSMHLSNQKFQLHVGLKYCMKLREDTLEAVAMHFKLSTTRSIIPPVREGSYASLYFPGSRIPECFRSYCARHDSVSVSFQLPLHAMAMGFIFCFVIAQGDLRFELSIKCHIELSNDAKVEFICGRSFLEQESDHVSLLYESSFSLKIMEELSRIKASATTNDLYTKVWFELLDNKELSEIREWGVYPIFTSSEPQNLLEL